MQYNASMLSVLKPPKELMKSFHRTVRFFKEPLGLKVRNMQQPLYGLYRHVETTTPYSKPLL